MDNSVALSLQQKNRENRKYKIMKHTTKKNFPVLEMGCTACAARVAKILGGLQGNGSQRKLRLRHGFGRIRR